MEMKHGTYVIGFFRCALCNKGIALCKDREGYSLAPSINTERNNVASFGSKAK